MRNEFHGLAAQLILTAGVSQPNSTHAKQWEEHNKAVSEIEKEVIDPSTFFSTNLTTVPTQAPTYVSTNAGPYLNYHLPRVLNKHTASKEEREHSVYVGRGTKYGNLNPINASDNRAKVILMCKKDWCKILSDRYGQADAGIINEWVTTLRGRSLVCYCAPYPCHADWLLAMVNSADPVRFTQQLIDEMRSVSVD